MRFRCLFDTERSNSFDACMPAPALTSARTTAIVWPRTQWHRLNTAYILRILQKLGLFPQLAGRVNTLAITLSI